ncbi:MAG: response regulator transcription factor [Cyclobacteriaceae bacterium]|nr:response regulator transcription factor [Cyclobacteriaceae bacterium]
MKVLIVEDEKDLQSILIDFLTREKYAYDAVSTYSEASERIALYDYDCILLDINLPDGSGFKLLDELNDVNKSEGVIIISARNSIDDKIKGLNLGADDYLTKPFHLSELNARIQAVIRRKKFDVSRKITFANIELDLKQLLVKVGQDQVSLTRKEFDILQHLIANKNIVISKNALLEYIWGDYVDASLSLDLLSTHLKNLKRKLKVAEAKAEIRNVYGVGYQIMEL